MRIELQIATPKGRRTFAHEGPSVQIGRDPACELALTADSVSWQHARIELTPQGATLSDSGSRNGTLLNEREVAGPSPLRAGDKIQLGYAGPSLTVVALDLAPLPAPWRQRPAILSPAAVAVLLLALVGWWALRENRQTVDVPEPVEASVEPVKKDPSPLPAVSAAEPLPQVKQIEPDAKTKIPPVPEKTAKAPAQEHAARFAATDNGPDLLLQRLTPEAPWQRLDAGSPDVHPNARLVALPGFQGDVRLGNGLRLRLWGIVPEQIFLPTPVRESVVELNPPGGADLDIILHRGRILLTSSADRPTMTRVRFQAVATPGWEVRLEVGAEILLERWGTPAAGHVLVRRGKARFQTAERTLELQGPPGDSYTKWAGAAIGPAVEKHKEIPAWAADAPEPPGSLDPKQRQLNETARQNVNAARALLAPALEDSVAISLRQALASADVNVRILAARGLGAVDDLPALARALEDAHGDVRRTAIETLRIWQTHRQENGSLLRAALARGYSQAEAAILATLLRDYSAREASQKETYTELVGYLTHARLAVRELAAWQLYLGLQANSREQVGRTISYDPTGEPAAWQVAQRAWLRLIEAGKLPARAEGN